MELIRFGVQYADISQINSITLVVFTLVLAIVHQIMRRHKRKGKLPSGPIAYPAFGYLPHIRQDYHIQFTQLNQKYGPVFQIYMGNNRLVVVSDPALVREIFKQPVFSGRPDTELAKILKGYGVINSVGALWKEQRSFLIKVLRDFGMKSNGNGDTALEKTIKTQALKFIQYLNDTKSEPTYVRVPLARGISSVIGSMLMSVTFDETDKGFERLLFLVEDGFRLTSIATPVNFIPLLRFRPSLSKAYAKIKEHKDETTAYFEKIAADHKKTLDKNNVRDFVDAFYLQQEKSDSGTKKTYFSEEQLLQVMGDVFSAGLETVTALLEWTFLFLVRHPEVQDKIRAEIESVIEVDRNPEVSDMQHMPYTEATMYEAMRRGNVIPIGNAHATLEDTYLGEFFIPKDTHVMPNLWAIHMDPKLWDDPEAFKPERFLVDGKVVKPQHFMPFSVGRRMCIGDYLTRMEVFLFLTNILRNFTLEAPKGEGIPPVHPEISLSIKPKPFRLCAVPRNNNS